MAKASGALRGGSVTLNGAAWRWRKEENIMTYLAMAARHQRKYRNGNSESSMAKSAGVIMANMSQ